MEQNHRIGYRPTWAEIDLDNLAYNYAQIKKKLSPGVKIMACVKAEAYGHGLVPVSRKLESCGADWFAVASVDEGISLRKAGIKKPILVLGLVLEQNIAPLFTYDITPTVCSESLARALDEQARIRDRIFNIHVKIDTGMGRIGVVHDKAEAFIAKIHSFANINIQGVFTHLACADSDDELTADQIGMFGRSVRNLAKRGIRVQFAHAANSTGVISCPSGHFNMVRPGLALYGLRPGNAPGIMLKPVMALKTRVVYVKDVPAGCGVSYGHTYVTSKPSRIATLPIGYGDGYPRNLSNSGPVLIKGRMFRISGRVCMDQMMVDVGECGARVGDEVVLIGRQSRGSISAGALADLAGTISYEIVCGIGSRVPRIYKSSDRSRAPADGSGIPVELRAAPRTERAVPVRFLDTPSLEDSMAVTRDISVSGLRVVTAHQVQPYKKFELSVELPHRAPARLSGTTVWSKPSSNGRYSCGIKLSKPLPSGIL